MIPQGRVRIINIASQLAVVAWENREAYCASKGGVASLTQVLALCGPIKNRVLLTRIATKAKSRGSETEVQTGVAAKSVI